MGGIALLCWTSGPSLLSELKSIPVFEILSFGLGTSFILTCLKLTYQKRWKAIAQTHWLIWVLGVFGLVGNDLFLVAGTKFAPPAHVHLLVYTWPTMVIVFTGLMSSEKWHMRYIIAALVGLLGIYYLVCRSSHDTFCWQYAPGYISALCGALVWACYCVLMRNHKQTPPEMIGMYCGVGAVISLSCHLRFESFVVPSTTQLGCLSIIGCVTSCLAFYLWDHGSKFGNLKFLSLLSYLSPLIGLAILFMIGRAEISSSLLIAALLIVSAPCLSFFSLDRIKRFSDYICNRANIAFS